MVSSKKHQSDYNDPVFIDGQITSSEIITSAGEKTILYYTVVGNDRKYMSSISRTPL